MNAKSFVAIIASLGAISLAGFTWKNFEAKRAAEKSLAGISARIAAEQPEIHRVEVQLAQSEEESATLHAALDALRRVAPQAAATKASPERATALKAPDVLKLLQTDPELQVRQLAAERARLTARYGSFYHGLNLPAAQIDKFEENAIRHKEQQMDMFALMQTQKITDTMADPVVSKLYQQEEAAYATAQTELLGAEGYRQLKEYERTSTVRDIVSGLAGAVTLAGEPFSAKQAEQLTQILANASQSYLKGNSANPSDIDWNAVDANAHTILSANQAVWIQTLEPNGPGGIGGRYLVRMNDLISEARKADAARSSSSAVHP